MIRGMDTTFLVEAEVVGHTHHRWARFTLDTFVAQGDFFALAPQVLAEFVHVVTDRKRFSQPLTMDQALAFLVRGGRISMTEATERALDPNELKNLVGRR